MHDAVMEAPFGKVGIRVDDAAGVVLLIEYLPPSARGIMPSSPLAVRAVEQITRYLGAARMTFDLPLADVGTPFQRRAWQAMCEIPAGQVMTYGELAACVGAVPRALGQACGDNPFPIVVPCHRVVGANGLGGFAHHSEDGFHLRVKRWLLAHEGAQQSLAL